MKRQGLLKIREGRPSKGEKLFPKRKPLCKGRPIDARASLPHSLRVVRMFDALAERGWTFRFKVEAVSPRGFSYSAEAPTPIEAFLKAFGQWRKEVVAFTPKIPAIVAGTKRPPEPIPKAYLSDLIRDAMGQTPKERLAPSEYRRVYMRAWRAKRRRESPAPLLVAV